MAHNVNIEAASLAEAITQGAAHNENLAIAAQATAIIQGVVNTENNAAAIAALIPLQRVLHTIVGLNRTQFLDVSADGYEDFVDFENMQWDNIEKYISDARKSHLNRGGLSISYAK